MAATNNIESVSQLLLEILNKFGRDLDQELRAELIRKKLVVTEELIRSLTYEVRENGNQVEYVLGFKRYGRFLQLKKLSYTTPPPWSGGQGDMLEWVLKKGLQEFDYVPGYTGKSVGEVVSKIGRQAAARKIARGIAYGKVKRSDKRRRPWLNAKYGRKKKQLFENLFDILFDMVNNEFENTDLNGS